MYPWSIELRGRYEEKIFELQRELNRYRQLVWTLLERGKSDIEVGYAPQHGSKVPDSFKKKFLRNAAPTIRVPGHEL